MCGAGVLPARMAGQARRQGWRVVAFTFGEAPGVSAHADRTIPSLLNEAGAVLAVEASEGTTDAIRRGIAHAGPGAVVVKAVARDHDYRFDTPTIGPETLTAAASGGATVVAVEAERVLILERDECLRIADEAGLALAGIA